MRITNVCLLLSLSIFSPSPPPRHHTITRERSYVNNLLLLRLQRDLCRKDCYVRRRYGTRGDVGPLRNTRRSCKTKRRSANLKRKLINLLQQQMITYLLLHSDTSTSSDVRSEIDTTGNEKLSVYYAGTFNIHSTINRKGSVNDHRFRSKLAVPRHATLHGKFVNQQRIHGQKGNSRIGAHDTKRISDNQFRCQNRVQYDQIWRCYFWHLVKENGDVILT